MATCDTCAAELGFNIIHPLPGTPVGRFVVPMVRINAKVDEMKPGMKIPAHFVEMDVQAVLTAALEDEAFLTNLQAALAALPSGG